MSYFTRFFLGPRPDAEAERVQRALRFLEALSPSDRTDIGIKPADFPRIARQMAQRAG